jgi:hypothetical protein
MSKKSKTKREHRKAHIQHARPYDPRRGDAITVAWVISTLACALAGIIGAIGLYLTRGTDVAANATLWQTLTPLMLFIAATSGLLVLCLTPLVYLSRRTPPPPAITVVALVVAAFPLVLLVVLAL